MTHRRRAARGRIESLDRQTGIEYLGVVIVGLLAVVMIAFVLLEWLQAYPVAGPLFEQFMVVGAWMDYLLGTAIFQYAFYWRTIATGVLIGIVAPLVGAFIVHREMALIGETLAHTAFAGIAFGLVAIGLADSLLGTTSVLDADLLLLFALVAGVCGSLGVKWLTERTSTYGDVPIAIMLVGSFAVGTLFVSWARSLGTASVSIEELLMGSITVVPAADARLMAALSVFVVAAVATAYKPLVFITFDEEAARVAQLPVDRYNTLLVVLTAVVVVGSLRVLGVILVAGMLVIPVAAASQLAVGFRETVVLSVLFGQASVLGGLALAFGADLPAGGSIIVFAIVVYLAAIAVSNRTTALSTR